MNRDFYVIPSIGKFKVSVREIPDPRNRDKTKYYTLKIGGKDDCVNLSIPAYTDDKSDKSDKYAKLSYTETIGKECTVNGAVIRGPASIEMIRLAFTIALEIAPHIEGIELDDMSKIPCITPSGQRMVSLAPIYIAMHNGKTWYEDKFDAYIKNPKIWEKYKELIGGLTDPAKKPAEFKFNNEDLQVMLEPLFESSATWADFFDKIKKTYPVEQRCAIMQPWLHNAMLHHIFDGHTMFEGGTWIIPLTSPAFKRVRYYEITGERGAGAGVGADVGRIGGGKKKKFTHKRRKQEDYISQGEMIKWKFIP